MQTSIDGTLLSTGDTNTSRRSSKKLSFKITTPNTLTDTSNTYRHPATFWRKIKNLSGTNNLDPKFFYNNIKTYTPEEKEAIHRQALQQIFTIDDDEDDNTDKSTISDTVKDYPETNPQRTTTLYH